jgi:hypothetical protein
MTVLRPYRNYVRLVDQNSLSAFLSLGVLPFCSDLRAGLLCDSARMKIPCNSKNGEEMPCSVVTSVPGVAFFSSQKISMMSTGGIRTDQLCKIPRVS